MTASPAGTDDQALREGVKALIIQCARLKITPAELGDDQPLFDPEKGPGLDSIDVLEIVVNLERTYGVSIPDRETGERVLRSVNTIVAHIKESNGKP